MRTFDHVQDPFAPGFMKHGRLLLPGILVHELDAAAQAEYERSQAELEEPEEPNMNAEEKKRKAAAEKAEREEKDNIASNPFHGLTIEKFGPAPKGKAPVIDLTGVEAIGKTLRAKYTERYEFDRVKAVGALIRENGPHRLLQPMPSNWREGLARLGNDMPNFRLALEILRANCAWSEARTGIPWFPPLLLDGSPGIGKSVFAQAVAELIGSCYHRVQMESSATGDHLSGSAEYWGNTKTGMLFNALIAGQHANPVFLLDEIDKAPKMEHHSSPLSALYSLWEPGSAQAFTDNSLPMLKLDTRNVLWLATANDRSKIPAPILSRMLVVPVPDLNRPQAVGVVLRIYAELAAQVSQKVNLAPLSEALAEKLAQESPRVAKRGLSVAIGRALEHGRLEVNAEDLAVGMGDAAALERVAGHITAQVQMDPGTPNHQGPKPGSTPN